eukprot:1145376-Pelagomonas_calceolata.AAC.7
MEVENKKQALQSSWEHSTASMCCGAGRSTPCSKHIKSLYNCNAVTQPCKKRVFEELFCLAAGPDCLARCSGLHKGRRKNEEPFMETG